jgi:hemoglobin
VQTLVLTYSQRAERSLSRRTLDKHHRARKSRHKHWQFSTVSLHTGIVTEENVYARIGEEGFARLIRAFYAQVPGDEVLGPMYPRADLQGAEERLRDFLVGRFGGPQRYIEQRGHPRLRMRHLPFAIDRAARDRWVRLMDRALDETSLPADVTSTLREFFHGTATFMMNR